MKLSLDCIYTASALGRGNRETFDNLLASRAPGMAEISGDIPGRSIWFGGVPGDLPEISDVPSNLRTNRLLKLAVESERGRFESLLAKYGAKRVGIVLGASNTGVDEAENFVDRWLDSGEKPEEFCFSALELGTPALYLKSLLGVEGPAYVISTACSSAAKSLGAARRLVERGICDAVVTGGVDGRCRFAMNGFHSLGALSEGRCRPLAEDRDGINLGEAVALFALEKGESDVFLAGVGESSDAYHATAPDPDGFGAEASMRAALADAGLEPSQIDYVNLHGTGTRANDDMEMKAFRRVFGEGAGVPRFESTKSLTGHCLGAAGAVEASVCCLLVRAGRCRAALSNSFAFGGSNASVVISA